MKTNNNNMKPQPKWHGHALNITKLEIKLKKITKDQRHKSNNRHHDSIPMVPKETQPEPSSRFQGNLYCHATPYIILP